MGNANLVPYFWVVRYTHGPTAFPSQSSGLSTDVHGNRVSERKKIKYPALSFFLTTIHAALAIGQLVVNEAT